MLRTLIRRGRLAFLGALVIGALAALAWLLDRPGAEIVGSARVIDGDSIVIAGTEIRLYGIDAPEYRQTCLRGGVEWTCGLEAARSMRTMVAGREIRCRTREEDRFGRTVAICRAGALDLGAAMVKAGHAIAHAAYQADEREARDARRGIWASTFDPPAVWRARHPRKER